MLGDIGIEKNIELYRAILKYAAFPTEENRQIVYALYVFPMDFQFTSLLRYNPETCIQSHALDQLFRTYEKFTLRPYEVYMSEEVYMDVVNYSED